MFKMDIISSCVNIFLAVTVGEIIKKTINFALDYNNIKYINVDRIPRDRKRGMIIISNHSNILDYTIIKKIIDCYCVASLSPFITEHLPNLNYETEYHILRYDYSPESGLQIKERILELVNNGKNVLVFPEGFSVRNSSRKECLLKPFKSGLFKLAFENNIDILPISQQHLNNNDISYFDNYKGNIVLNIEPDDLIVDVTVHNVISPSQFSSDEEFKNACHFTIQSSLSC